MAISRMQEPRQLYGLGSLVRKITKPIKKAVKGVGKIAKSPIGKLALLAAAGYGLGAVGPGGFSKARMFSRLGLGSLNPGTTLPGSTTSPSFLSTLNPFGQNFSLKNLGFTAGAAGAILPFVAPNLFAPKIEEEEAIDYTQTPEGIAAIVEQAKDYYRTGGSDLLYMPRGEYVRRNFFAAKGGPVPGSTVPGYTTPAGYNKFDYRTGGIPVRTPKKEGGLMDLGGREMDLRANGGFIPIGAKEKADDVPARLSKNEFVMTADAVRGAGNGNIERGAQKMYNTMKQLESKVA